MLYYAADFLRGSSLSMSTTDEAVAAMSAGQFRPDVAFPEDGAAIEFWGVVAANDRVGIVIDGLKKGDVVHVSSLNGIASFAESSNKLLAGFIEIAGGLLQNGLNYYSKGQAAQVDAAIDKHTRELVQELSKDVKHKRRDAYGMDPGTDDFGKNEGGIIFCMPKSRGALYAAKENYLKGGAKHNSRLPEYFSDNIKRVNSWFPSRKEGGLDEKTVTQNGPLHVLAFDSDFRDNSGSYVIKLKVTRQTEQSTHTELLQMLEDQKNS